MPDIYENLRPGLSSPPSRAFTVTPSDSTDLSLSTRAIMIATQGSVALHTVTGDVITLPALQPGVQYAIRARRILTTGTTATGIIGLA